MRELQNRQRVGSCVGAMDTLLPWLDPPPNPSLPQAPSSLVRCSFAFLPLFSFLPLPSFSSSVPSLQLRRVVFRPPPPLVSRGPLPPRAGVAPPSLAAPSPIALLPLPPAVGAPSPSPPSPLLFRVAPFPCAP